MAAPFLRAEWRRLLLLNYRVDPTSLAEYLPAGTELDLWNDTCYVSLVGFMFLNTSVRGVRIPFHVNFEEVNLRFYVKRQDPELGLKRGVVFVREIVPKPAIAWVANAIYHEKYAYCPMLHTWNERPDQLEVQYAWHKRKRWHSIAVQADPSPQMLKPGSEAAFITEHYWGYSKRDAKTTVEYKVERESWQVYSIRQWHADVDFGAVYGPAFAGLTHDLPLSIFLAEGSPISVSEKNLLRF